MPEFRFTILGCGSSGGVPRLGNNWGACDPKNDKNTRTRCSLLVQRFQGKNVTTVLIDTSPDMRLQLLRVNIGVVDGVVFTHEHADHTHGLDDLRMIFINRGQRIPVWANKATRQALEQRFHYAFKTPKGSHYPAMLEMRSLDGTIVIKGSGGAIKLTPVEVIHGTIQCSCIRINQLLYAPDISAIPASACDYFNNLDYLIIDALRYKPHPSHAHVVQTLNWIAKYKPKQAILTNMHIDIDYDTINKQTPAHIIPAFDGMVIRYHI